ncbi:hypothetical protein LBMAG42_57190 [Deltaproteobacteria bacterium]|nr:hypothetical protein LBMAG42_57190 [Deltaproteobacteria bacterium]
MSTTYDLIVAADILVTTSWKMTEEEFASRLAAFVDESTDKLAALRAVHKAADARAKGLKAEAAAYADAAKAQANIAERVKGRAAELFAAAEKAGEVLPGGRTQPNGGALPMDFAADFSVMNLPIEFWKIEPDGDAIRAALGTGATLPGVTIGKRGSHFRFVEAK